MTKGNAGFSAIAAALALAISVAAVPSRANAQSTQELLQRIEAMERQLEGMKQLDQDLQALKAQLKATDAATRQAEAAARQAQDQAEAVQKQAQAAEKQARATERQARQAERADAKWHLSGYASTGFRVSDKGDEEDTFEAGRLNPIFHFQYKDLVLFEGEFQFQVNSAGKTDTELEYATIDVLLHDDAALMAGKFLSPIGQFQTRLHPDWINKFPNAPAGFGHGGVQPLSDVGVMLHGGFAFNPLVNYPLVNYAIFVGNGPQLEFEDELEAIEFEGFGSDNNGNKSLGGRIGILPIPHLEIGGSFMTADIEGVAGSSGPVTEGEYTLWGVDAAFTRGPWDVRFEYLSSELDSFFSAIEADEATELVPETDFDAWYVQVAYQLRGVTDARFLRNLEPVVRYGEVDAEGFAHFVGHIVPEDRLSVGLDYWIAPSAVAKFAVSWRDFVDSGAEDATEFRGQLAYGF